MAAETKIHPLAVIEKGAELGVDVSVGPFCVVSAGARIGDRTKLHSHVVLDGHIEIGVDNEIFPYCIFGGPPQDLGYKGEPTKVVIGDRNRFREHCSIHRATMKDRQVTKVGSDNYIMGYCHFAHDCVVGNHIIMANQSAFAGHVECGDHVIIGGQSGVQQKVRIGDYSFIGGATALRRDLPPFMCVKEFSQVSGPNIVGLKRNGLPDDEIRVAMEIFKLLYLGNLTTEKSLVEIDNRFGKTSVGRKFVDFARATKVGIQR
jgi:UDP-N-acetylglucosamine acyltransferase